MTSLGSQVVVPPTPPSGWGVRESKKHKDRFFFYNLANPNVVRWSTDSLFSEEGTKNNQSKMSSGRSKEDIKQLQPIAIKGTGSSAAPAPASIISSTSKLITPVASETKPAMVTSNTPGRRQGKRKVIDVLDLLDDDDDMKPTTSKVQPVIKYVKQEVEKKLSNSQIKPVTSKFPLGQQCKMKDGRILPKPQVPAKSKPEPISARGTGSNSKSKLAESGTSIAPANPVVDKVQSKKTINLEEQSKKSTGSNGFTKQVIGNASSSSMAKMEALNIPKSARIKPPPVVTKAREPPQLISIDQLPKIPKKTKAKAETVDLTVEEKEDKTSILQKAHNSRVKADDSTIVVADDAEWKQDHEVNGAKPTVNDQLVLKRTYGDMMIGGSRFGTFGSAADTKTQQWIEPEDMDCSDSPSPAKRAHLSAGEPTLGIEPMEVDSFQEIVFEFRADEDEQQMLIDSIKKRKKKKAKRTGNRIPTPDTSTNYYEEKDDEFARRADEYYRNQKLDRSRRLDTSQRVLYLVFDTNVFLGELNAFNHVMEAKHMPNSFDQVKVVVPYMVCCELDRFKLYIPRIRNNNKCNPERLTLNKRARNAEMRLLKYKDDDRVLLQTSAENEATFPGFEGTSLSPDDMILKCALQWHANVELNNAVVCQEGSGVLLVTNDNNLRLKAAGNHMEAIRDQELILGVIPKK